MGIGREAVNTSAWVINVKQLTIYDDLHEAISWQAADKQASGSPLAPTGSPKDQHDQEPLPPEIEFDPPPF